MAFLSRFSVSLSYYGISFSIPDLSGDRHLNFMIDGGEELARVDKDDAKATDNTRLPDECQSSGQRFHVD